MTSITALNANSASTSGPTKRPLERGEQDAIAKNVRTSDSVGETRTGSFFEGTRKSAESTFERQNARLYKSQSRVQDDIEFARKLLEGAVRTRSVGRVSSTPAPTAPTQAELDLSASIAALDSYVAEAQAAAVDGKVDAAGLSAAPTGISSGVDALVDATRPDELTYQAVGDQVVIEAQDFTYNNSGTDGADWYYDSAQDMMVATEVAGRNRYRQAADTEANAARLDYKINFAEAGTYYVWVNGKRSAGADLSNSNSVQIGLNGAMLTGSLGLKTNEMVLGWSNDDATGASGVSIEVTEATELTLNMWVREDGTGINSILLTKDATFTPTGAVAASTTTTTQGEASPINLADLEALAAAERTRLSDELSALEAERAAAAASEPTVSGNNDYLQAIIDAQTRGLERIQSVTEERKTEFVNAQVVDEAATLLIDASAFMTSASVAYTLMASVSVEEEPFGTLSLFA